MFMLTSTNQGKKRNEILDFGLEVLGRHYKNLGSSIVITLFNGIFEVNVPKLKVKDIVVNTV